LYNNYGTTNAIQFTSNASVKTINMSPTQKLKIDAAGLPPGYVSSESGPALWTPSDTTILIHEFSNPTTFENWSAIGGTNFNGHIAEAIFFTNTTVIPEAKLDEIRDQLNAIHGAY
jgi:hypothetical protein